MLSASPYHSFYTVRFAMCIPFTDHIAPPRSPYSSQGYEIWYSRHILYVRCYWSVYMDLHLNICTYRREIWNRFIDFFYWLYNMMVVWRTLFNNNFPFFIFFIFLYMWDEGEYCTNVWVLDTTLYIYLRRDM